MVYLILAVLSSVSVAATIKVSETAGRNRVSVALVNYCIAACFMFVLWFVRGAVSVSGITVACGIYAGITWVVSLILMMYAMKLIGIAINTDGTQRNLVDCCAILVAQGFIVDEYLLDGGAIL